MVYIYHRVLQEDGNFEVATPEKLRLEEKQRIARRVRKENGVEWQNMWFVQVRHWSLIIEKMPRLFYFEEVWLKHVLNITCPEYQFVGKEYALTLMSLMSDVFFCRRGRLESTK